MNHRSLRAFAVAFLALVSGSAAWSAEAPAKTPTPYDWPAIKREYKPWTRWWWLGSAVDKANITRELQNLAAAGFGGVEITPIYGARGYEQRYLEFLSPQYVEMLAFTCIEAKRLGLAVDMATGTGWPFGGKQVSRDDAELQIEIKEGAFAPKLTKFRVKRAAPGGEGWVLNPFSPRAMERYLQPFSTALETLPAGALHGQFHDSFEYTANWSKELPEKFAEMHGYKLEDYVATLEKNTDTETISRLKSDYRETLGQLHLDYVATWIAWTHAHGQIARNQAHGAPANLLDLYAQADIPETEVFGGSPYPIPGYRFDPAELSRNVPQPLVNRFASSAGHVAGRPLISSETFTWLREHFHESPSEMKPQLDELFLTGINHVFYHGCAYSPADAPWPGWLFYASTQFNPRNPLWKEFSSLNDYIARCQALLQAGQPDNDLLVYWPVYDLWDRPEGWNRNFSMHGRDWLTDSSTGKLAQELVSRGYSFDFISDAQLLKTNVLEKLLQAPGARYRALVIPQTRLMPPATLERVLALARQGATVLIAGDLPTDVPGLGRLEQRRARFNEAKSAVKWTGDAADQTASVGRGKLYRSENLDTLLNHSGVTPEPAVSRGLGYVRRMVDGAPVYFLANLSAQPVDGWVEFGRGAPFAALLDPRTGQTGLAALRSGQGAPQVYLQLKPGESVFVKFSRTAPPATIARWAYVAPDGEGAPISGEWSVSFTSGGPELPPAYHTTELKSWTAQGGPAESFAGSAIYETEFELPADVKADDWLLDLGDVRETARVWINVGEVDRLWSLPFQTRIGKQLRPGKNNLRLEVANLGANRIRYLDMKKAPWKNFHEINFVDVHYQPFDASRWPLQPSGVLGPVRVIPLKKVVPDVK